MTTKRQDLIDMIDVADLCCPEQVADRVLSIYDERGYDAAVAEIERAKACDAAEAKRLGIE